jgi:hypothetical protein
MFFVVEFVNGSVEVVPDNWINGDGKFCYWPKFSKDKMFRAIQKKTEPDDNWERSDIKRVMRKCGMYFFYLWFKLDIVLLVSLIPVHLGNVLAFSTI